MPDQPAAPGQENWQYDQFLHGHVNRNVLDRAKREDPFAGETPTIGKDYRAYQQHWESSMHEALGQAAILKITAGCETLDHKGNRIVLPGPKKTHIGSSVVFACDHIITQDPLNPDGCYFYPLVRGKGAGYYLCPACYRAHERHKFDFGKEIKQKCALCIGEKLSEIEKRFPDRLVYLPNKS